MLGKTRPASCRINISGGASTCEHQSASNVSNRNAGGVGGKNRKDSARFKVRYRWVDCRQNWTEGLNSGNRCRAVTARSKRSNEVDSSHQREFLRSLSPICTKNHFLHSAALQDGKSVWSIMSSVNICCACIRGHLLCVSSCNTEKLECRDSFCVFIHTPHTHTYTHIQVEQT